MSQKQCTNCGAFVDESAQFCTTCGNRFCDCRQNPNYNDSATQYTHQNFNNEQSYYNSPYSCGQNTVFRLPVSTRIFSIIAFSSGIASAAFSTILFWFPYVALVSGIVGLVFSIISKDRIKNCPITKYTTFANQGFIFSIIGICLSVALVILWITFIGSLIGLAIGAA